MRVRVRGGRRSAGSKRRPWRRGRRRRLDAAGGARAGRRPWPGAAVRTPRPGLRRPGADLGRTRATTAATRCSPAPGWPAAGLRGHRRPLPGHAARARAGRAAGRRWSADRHRRAGPGPTSVRATTGRAPTWWSTACSASAAGRVCPTTVALLAGDLPSGLGPDRRGRPAVGSGRRHRRGARRGSIRRDPHRHLRRAQALSPDRAGPAALRRDRAGRHRPGRLRPAPRPVAGGLGGRRRGGALAATRTRRSDKYARGVVGIDTGSDPYPGAGDAVHPRRGARRSRDGPLPRRRPAGEIDRPASCPTSSSREGRVQSWLLGSGWGDRADGDRRDAAGRSTTGLPAVVDADGLRHLPDRLPEHVLLTPHAGRAGPAAGPRARRVTADPVARGPGRRPTRPVPPCCSRAPPSWWPHRAGDRVEVAVPGPGLDRSGRVGRRAGRPVRRRCWRRAGRPRTAAVLARLAPGA